MHELLTTAQHELGVDLSNIAKAAEESEAALADTRQAARQYLIEAGTIDSAGSSQDLGLVVFGSLARRELSKAESDFDHAVLAYGNVELPERIIDFRKAARVAQRAANLKSPGTSRMFGGLIVSADLVNRIGLDDDTNRTHTQRMLFLEESVPIVGAEAHQLTVATILRRYLVDYHRPDLGKVGVPRFLLNDVVRYWRTLAVDYQAKRWDEMDPFSDDQDEPKPKWGMRYIKLRSSRKLAFCGTVISLFVPRLRSVEVDENLLIDQFDMPALARLAQLLEYLDADEDRVALAEILVHADWFAGQFADSDFRDEVNKVEHPRAPGDNAVFAAARHRTMELESALERLFQSDNVLRVANANPLPGYSGGLCMRQFTARYLLF